MAVAYSAWNVLEDFQNGLKSFVGRSSRSEIGLQWSRIVESVDWTRVLWQALGEHSRTHSGDDETTCGDCIKTVLLRDE